MAHLFKWAGSASPFSLRSKGEAEPLCPKAFYRINDTLPWGEPQEQPTSLRDPGIMLCRGCVIRNHGEILSGSLVSMPVYSVTRGAFLAASASRAALRSAP